MVLEEETKEQKPIMISCSNIYSDNIVLNRLYLCGITLQKLIELH